MRIFISHSSHDLETAELLIDLLRKSLTLGSTDIRCSSVDGYRLPGGVSTDERLRTEVHDAELVIGLITPNSLKSAYVSFELGARWGAGRPMIPLLASGTTPEQLEGPLAGISALDCSNESQVNQLVEDASTHIGMDPDQPSSYVAEVRNLVLLSSESAATIEYPYTDSETPQLSAEAKELLIEATRDQFRLIRILKLMSGMIVETNRKQFNETGDPRSEAIWESAVDELIDRGFVKDDDGEGLSFSVTRRGFEAADKLSET